LPFPLTGGHYDNGMEFINKPLLEWCLAKHIRASRSRPYHKNDRSIRGKQGRTGAAERLLKTNREKGTVKEPSSQEACQAEAV
jgi:transposase InsO family protein